jgi:hypothetical protein
MKLMTFFAFYIFLPAMSWQGRQVLDKAAFYHIMASGDRDAVEGELTQLGKDLSVENDAYTGALLMRKAGLLVLPGERLRSFKAGRVKLETALAKDSTNGEYHFLRLIIQEHAPAIVRYSNDLQNDRDHIRRSFKTLPPAVQKAILDYSKNSKTLHPEDLGPKND